VIDVKSIGRSIIRRALSHDGVDDFISIQRSPSLNFDSNLTLMAWVYARAWPPQKCIMDRNNYYAFGFYNGYMWSWLNLPTKERVSPTLRSLNTWYHIVATYDGVTRKHYVNGMLDNSWTENAILTQYDSIRMIIGANANDTNTAEVAPNGFFNGVIAEVRIYNRALSQAEIQWLYNNGKGHFGRVGIRNGCVLCLDPSRWRGSGWVKDISGYGNHGRIFGAQRVRCDL